MIVFEEFFRFVLDPDTEETIEINGRRLSKVTYHTEWSHTKALPEHDTSLDKLRAARRGWEEDHEGFVKIWLQVDRALSDQKIRKRKFHNDMLKLDLYVVEAEKILDKRKIDNMLKRTTCKPNNETRAFR